MCSDLSESQYTQAMQVASQIPHLQIAKAFFKVVGERVVTPSSLVQLVIKARVIPPGTTNVPTVNPLDLEDIDPDEGDLDALNGRQPAKTKRRKMPDGRVIEDESKDNSVQPPLAHAPYFPADHAPRWHVFLSEARTGRISVPPFTFTAFDKPIYNADGTPTFNMLTLKCPFQAPPMVHAFPFVLHLVCDSYIGLDSKLDVLLDVREASEANVVESDDEISEPDEDTLAGQLQAMKTGGLTGSPTTTRKKKKSSPASQGQSVPVAQIQSGAAADSDDSDTEGDNSDTSETDTETEDEDS